MLSTLVEEQHRFLSTSDAADLRPLAQQHVVELLATIRSNDPRPCADASRVSRVLRAGSLVMADGTEVNLGRLCPSPREVHRQIVREVVRRERARMMAGEISAPLTDQEIAGAVQKRSTFPVSRRVVAFVRKELGIPNHRMRAQRGCYLTITAGFSSLVPAAVENFRVEVPRAPGVYEIRVEPPGVEYPAGHCTVVYLGSSNDLRGRLLDQLRGNGRNPRLAAYLEEARSQVRWMVVREGWRQRERRIYEQFVETFGAPPECNRMSP